jgi:putative ATP-dependent endonuclease of OLD family
MSCCSFATTTHFYPILSLFGAVALFILANPSLFDLSGKPEEEMATVAYKMVPKRYQKTNFALKYALEQLDWTPPFYLVEGLQWLAKNPNVPATEVEEVMVNVIEETI